MPRRSGHDSGQLSGGLDWATYLDWLVATTGSLAAVADRLCAHRGYRDDIGSVERALRRLRRRGTLDGGTWGTRALAAFGLPEDAHRHVRSLAQYHARIADLPVPACADLIRAWDHPPTTASRDGRAWLALAHASLSLRRFDHTTALTHLDRARADLTTAPAAARAESLLMRAYIASKSPPRAAAPYLAALPPLLATIDDADDRACLHARHTDHLAYELNRRSDHAAAAALYLALPTTAPPFALARRASGLAYAHWKQALSDAAAWAHRAVSHAGDGGHLRARAMALALLHRITGDAAPLDRALSIARRLEDATLLARFAAPARVLDA